MMRSIAHSSSATPAPPKDILFLLSSGRDLSTFPAVYQLAAECGRRGARVSIVTAANCEDAAVRAVFHDFVQVPGSTSGWRQSWALIQSVWKRSFDVLVAFDPRDAWLMAPIAVTHAHSAYAYDNLEIFQVPRLESPRRLPAWLLAVFRKRLERAFAARSDCLVTHDSGRMALLERCGIAHPRTFLVPNTYYSRVALSPPPTEPKGHLLYTGSLERWALGDLENEATAFRELRVTFSGWSRDGYVKRLRELVGEFKAVRVLEQSLTQDDYFSLICKHDVGLVWYAPPDENVRQMGLSSGKLFAFLACGRPVIAQDLPGLADHVRELGVGEVVSRLSDVPSALSRIVANYPTYRRNVEAAMSTRFDYLIAGAALADHLAATESSPNSAKG